MSLFSLRLLPVLFLAALLAGIGPSHALCVTPDPTLFAKSDTVDVLDSGSVSLPQKSQPDSLVVQEGEQVVPERATAQKDEESGWDWQAIGVIVALAIAVVGWGLFFYQRQKMLQDAKRQRFAELEAEEEHRRQQEEKRRKKEFQKKQERLETDEEQYLEHLCRSLKKSEIFGFRGIDGAEESVGVTETFVPLDIDVESKYESEADRRRSFERHEQDELQYVKPEEALAYTVTNDKRMLLIIGEPGSGKTTIIKHFALNRNLRLPGCDDKPVILYIPLKSMAMQGAEKKSLPTILSGVFEPHFSVDESWFENRLRHKRVLLLLDGLDEISSSDQRVNVLRWLTRALETYRDAVFVMTTRDGGFMIKEQNALRLSPQRAYVQRFTPEQQELFLRNWFRAALLRDADMEIRGGTKSKETVEEKASNDAARLRDYLLQPDMKGLKELAGIPLLLQIMAIFWKKEKYLPNNEDELYDHALDFLLELRDREKDMKVLIEAKQAKMLLGPVALWMQEYEGGEPIENIDKGNMHELVQKEIKKIPTIALGAEDICENLADRSGVLIDAGSTYVFRHKTFREYLAGVQLQTSVNDDPERLASLVKRVGDPAWEEPLLFFMAKAKAGLFTRFMRALFESKHFVSLDQAAQTQLHRLIDRASQKTVEAFQEKLLSGSSSPLQQQYLLDCLKVLGTPEAADVALEFRQERLDTDREVLRKVDEVIGLAGKDSREPEEKGAEQELRGIVAQNSSVWYSEVEYSSQYILLEGGDCGGFHLAKYAVTNKLYRKFIASLQSMEKREIEDIFSRKFDEITGSIAGFREYLNKGKSFSEIFVSRYDTDRRFKGEDQPVVGVSWFGAKAYCIWLSLMESEGRDAGLYRLPYEDEWYYAAAGTEKRHFPWGDTPEPTAKHANYDENEGSTTPVGRYPDGATPEGLYDMAGNVWEWMENWYDKDEDWKALRGGSWLIRPENLVCSYRFSSFPDLRGLYFGFRVVRPSPAAKG